MRTDLTQDISLTEITGIAPRVYTEPVDPRHTALILVDMQGSLTKSIHVEDAQHKHLRAALGGCERLLEAARKNAVKVVHIVLGSWTLDGSDLSDHKQRANRLYRSQGRDPVAERAWDSPNAQIYPSLTPIRGEILLHKTGGSAFQTTGLATILHNMRIHYTVFAGQLTEGCMGLTAMNAHDHGFAVTIADGASYGASRAGHLVILRLFDQHWGRVRTVEEIARELESGGASG